MALVASGPQRFQPGFLCPLDSYGCARCGLFIPEGEVTKHEVLALRQSVQGWEGKFKEDAEPVLSDD